MSQKVPCVALSFVALLFFSATAFPPNIAGRMQRGGKHVNAEDVERARLKGATDKEIRDTVLIAAAFCMCKCYVDGLVTWARHYPEVYRETGKRLAQQGFVRSMDRL